MKKQLLLLSFIGLAFTAFSQEINQDLKSFEKIIASPKINVILEKGEKETIRLVYSGVSQDKINIEVYNKTLHLYLDDAKIINKNELKGHRYRRDLYVGASVTAYITYKDIRYLEIRGDQELTCTGPLEAEVFTLKAYGENEITLASLNTAFLRASLYGENKLKIKKGKAFEQKYRLFGENRIYTQNLRSSETQMNIYGEGKSRINAEDQLRITAFGEPEIHVEGGAQIKRLVFGVARISRD